MKFKLGSNTYKALDGSSYEERIEIKKETEKAILLSITKRGKEKECWLPKSQIEFSERSVMVPDWLWGKHES
jgi:hypothetical protein